MPLLEVPVCCITGVLLDYNNNNNNNNIYLTANGSSPGGSGFCHIYKKTGNVHLN
jgi:hypothetical protein